MAGWVVSALREFPDSRAVAQRACRAAAIYSWGEADTAIVAAVKGAMTTFRHCGVVTRFGREALKYFETMQRQLREEEARREQARLQEQRRLERERQWAAHL